MKRFRMVSYLCHVTRIAAITVAGMLVLTGCAKTDSVSGTPAASASSASAAAPAPAPGIEIPAGTVLEIRVDQALSTARNREGDKFPATLELPLDIGGREVLPRGTRITGA